MNLEYLVDPHELLGKEQPKRAAAIPSWVGENGDPQHLSRNKDLVSQEEDLEGH